MSENPSESQAAALEADLAAAAPAASTPPKPEAPLPPIDDPGAIKAPTAAELTAAGEKAIKEAKAAEAKREEKAEAFKGPEDGPLQKGPRPGTCYRVKAGASVGPSTGRLSMGPGTLAYAGDPRLRKYPALFEVCDVPKAEKPPPRFAPHPGPFPIAVGPRSLPVR